MCNTENYVLERINEVLPVFSVKGQDIFGDPFIEVYSKDKNFLGTITSEGIKCKDSRLETICQELGFKII